MRFQLTLAEVLFILVLSHIKVCLNSGAEISDVWIHDFFPDSDFYGFVSDNKVLAYAYRFQIER